MGGFKTRQQRISHEVVIIETTFLFQLQRLLPVNSKFRRYSFIKLVLALLFRCKLANVANIPLIDNKEHFAKDDDDDHQRMF